MAQEKGCGKEGEHGRLNRQTDSEVRPGRKALDRPHLLVWADGIYCQHRPPLPGGKDHRGNI